MISRREFLRTSSAAVVAAAWTGNRAVAAGSTTPLVREIQRSVIWNDRGKNPAWFHPRACMIPGNPPVAFMALQRISGSDYFHPVQWSMSSDLGKTWSTPQPIPGFGRTPLPGGLENGVCDVVPTYHAKTRSVLAMGHNVYYQNGRLTQPSTARHPVYAVRDAQGNWSELRKLVWEDPRATAIYTCGCSQRVTLDNGDLLVPLSFGPLDRKDRAVGSVLCAFDGQRLEVRKATVNELRLPVGRGLLEPSLTLFRGRFYMTIRAEDGCGYVSVSDDGLEWSNPRPWAWDDGTRLAMSTTQQHWVTHSDGLLLAYTRKSDENAKVFRWRAPLYVAQVDLSASGPRLLRATEQIALPLVGDGIKHPDGVARMGNFHVTAASPQESWITVGECLPKDGWTGDTLLARLHWSTPNRLSET
jgi:hypothetical protein